MVKYWPQKYIFIWFALNLMAKIGKFARTFTLIFAKTRKDKTLKFCRLVEQAKY